LRARLDSGPSRRLAVIKDLLAQRDASSIRAAARRSSTCCRSFGTPGLPDPVQQYPVRVEGRSYVLDFAWPDRKSSSNTTGWRFTRVRALLHTTTVGNVRWWHRWRPLVFDDTTSDRQIVRDVEHALSTAP